MSVGRNLQEMENVVTKGASPAETPSTSATPVVTPGQTGSWEDLGGPTPENYRPDDDSAKLKDATLAQVRDVVNAKAAAADSMKEETEEDEDLVDEEELDEDEEVVAEESHKKGKKHSKKEDEDLVDEEDEEDEMKEEFDIEEDVNALLAGEELSEEFQEKARTIFEAAIRSKVAENQRRTSRNL
jgi:hypothetical protein